MGKTEWKGLGLFIVPSREGLQGHKKDLEGPIAPHQTARCTQAEAVSRMNSANLGFMTLALRTHLLCPF